MKDFLVYVVFRFIAGIFGFEKREYFEIEDEAERKAPEVKF